MLNSSLAGQPALPFDFLFRLFLLPNQTLLSIDHVRYRPAQFLVFLLVVQKEVQVAREIRLFRFGEGDALLHAEFLEFDKLADRLLQIAGTVAHHSLLLRLVFDLPGKIRDLLLKRDALGHKVFVLIFFLDGVIIGAANGPDVVHKEAKHSEYQHRKDEGEQPYGKPMNPCSL